MPAPGFCVSCGSPLPEKTAQEGASARCPACGRSPFAVSLAAAGRKSPGKKIALAGAAVAVAVGGLIAVALSSRGGEEWGRLRGEVVEAARAKSAGLFKARWSEAEAFAKSAGREKDLEALRVEVEGIVTADFAQTLARIEEMAKSGDAAGALREWRGLDALNAQTPGAGRAEREARLLEPGLRISRAGALAAAGRGEIELALELHRTGCDVCRRRGDAGVTAEAHAELEKAVAAWIETRRGPIAAAAGGTDDEVVAAAGPAALALARLKEHDAGNPSKPWSPGLVRAFESALASVPVRRVRVVVAGDARVVERVRGRFRASFPYEVEIVGVAVGGEAPDEPGLWADARVDVDWAEGEYTFTKYPQIHVPVPLSLKVSRTFHSEKGLPPPWAPEPWAATGMTPQQIRVEGDIPDDIERRARSQADDIRRRMQTSLDAWIDTWPPWQLPAPKTK